MYSRAIQFSENKSFFLFGPRGTGNPMARAYLFYGGPHHLFEEQIELIPLEKAIRNLPTILK